MRAMNTKAATTMPTSMATVRSKNTVEPKVSSSTSRSPFGAGQRVAEALDSLMFQATTTSIAASAAIGT
jgi:hypothetical protein